MELFSSQQVLPEVLNRVNFDLFLTVSGYEKRVVYLLEEYNISAVRKIAMAFVEKSGELYRKQNEKIIRDNGFEIVPVSGENWIQFDSIFLSICQQSNNKVVRILVDYSSMTKVWYSKIINTLLNLSSCSKRIEVYFSYTPGSFYNQGKVKPATIAHSLSTSKMTGKDPSMPIALIIGLGLDNLRPETLIKKINPSNTYLFYADPGNHPGYIKEIFRNNQKLIESVEIRNLFNYPIKNLGKTDEILTNLCLDLRQKFHIIIAPVGPKVFTLISLLLAARYPDLEVWRVSRGMQEPAIDRKPDGDPLIYKVNFGNDDSE